MPTTLIQSFPEFKRLIAQHNKLTVVDFFASWCGPCKAIAPKFEKLSNKFTSVNFCKINVDNLPEISKEYGITAMPTFKIFRNSKVIDTIIGADVNALESKIQLNANSQSPFSGKGQRLGSDTTESTTANNTTTATTSTTSNSNLSNSSSLVWIAVFLLTLYWWNSRRKDLSDNEGLYDF